MKGRVSFKPGAVQHVYQNTRNGFLIFYSVKDCLVFFTIFSTVARIHGVRVLGLCLMSDHIHVLVQVDDKEHLSRFVQHYTTWFSQMYNKWHGQKGAFFRGPFGFASKVTDKEIRSAIAYLLNNPVEKQICRRPEEARWNFLAYGSSGNPFSTPLRIRYSNASFRRAIKEVDFERSADRPLNYVQLLLMAQSLNHEEQLQLTDYIITTYNCIDYDVTAGFFGNYDDLVAGVNVAKGSEYSIREDFIAGSDLIYSKMTQSLIEKGAIGSTDDLLRLPEESRKQLLEPLSMITGAGYKKVSKYLHLAYPIVEGNALIHSEIPKSTPF